MSENAPVSASAKSHLLCAAAILALGAAVYSQTLRIPFVFDDRPNISDNEFVRVTSLDPAALYRAAFDSPSSRRPVANVSFALNHVYGGHDVRGYHAVNIAIHLVNGILVYALFLVTIASSLPGRARSRPHWAALGAALIFITHPIQTQAVTYTVQRMTSMAAMFYLSSLLLWILGRRGVPPWRRWTLWAAAAVLWLLALGTKQIAITLPLVVWLYEWFFFRDLSRAWLKRWSLAAVAVATILVLVGLLYTDFQPLARIQAEYADRDFSLTQRLATQPRVVVSYLALILFPHPWRLNLHHHFALSESMIQPAATVVAAAALGGLFVLSVWTVRRHRVVAFFGLWLFIHLLVESSVWPLEMAFEHRLYLPMFGVAILCLHLLSRIGSGAPSAALAAMVLIICGLSSATFARNATWQQRARLWTDVIAKNPASYRGHSNLGIALSATGQHEASIREQRRALRIKPDSAMAHYKLGKALGNAGELEQAIGCYRDALSINPQLVAAHNMLGLALLAKGNAHEANGQFLDVVRLDPNGAEGFNNLGMARHALGQHDIAIDDFRTALALRPEFADAQNNLGEALRRAGQFEASIEHFRRALAISPGYGEAHYNLGLTLRSLGRMPDAADCFRHALEVNPHWPDARYHLAHALIAQHLVDAAVTQLRRTVRESPDHVAALNELAWLLATNHEHTGSAGNDAQEAVTLAEHAAKLTTNRSPSILDTLAAAYAAAHRYDAAARTARRAMTLAVESGRDELAEEFRRRLDRYEQHLPVESGQ